MSVDTMHEQRIKLIDINELLGVDPDRIDQYELDLDDYTAHEKIANGFDFMGEGVEKDRNGEDASSDYGRSLVPFEAFIQVQELMHVNGISQEEAVTVVRGKSRLALDRSDYARDPTVYAQDVANGDYKPRVLTEPVPVIAAEGVAEGQHVEKIVGHKAVEAERQRFIAANEDIIGMRVEMVMDEHPHFESPHAERQVRADLFRQFANELADAHIAALRDNDLIEIPTESDVEVAVDDARERVEQAHNDDHAAAEAKPAESQAKPESDDKPLSETDILEAMVAIERRYGVTGAEKDKMDDADFVEYTDLQQRLILLNAGSSLDTEQLARYVDARKNVIHSHLELNERLGAILRGVAVVKVQPAAAKAPEAPAQEKHPLVPVPSDQRGRTGRSVVSAPSTSSRRGGRRAPAGAGPSARIQASVDHTLNRLSRGSQPVGIDGGPGMDPNVSFAHNLVGPTTPVRRNRPPQSPRSHPQSQPAVVRTHSDIEPIRDEQAGEPQLPKLRHRIASRLARVRDSLGRQDVVPLLERYQARRRTQNGR